MRSVVVVLPASICAAIPMLRVRSIEYCRLGELTDLGLVTFSFSNTASMCFLFENKNAPRTCFGHRGALRLYTITSGNAQMLYWPGPFCGPHRVCEWHFPVPDTLRGFLPPELPSSGCLCGHRQNQPASAGRARTDGRPGLRAEPGKWRRRRGGP